MFTENQEVIDPGIELLRRQLDEWRRSRKKGKRIPRDLWEQAVELSKEHSVAEVSRLLRLDYTRLKKRVEASSKPRTPAPEKSPAPTFVEVEASQPAAPSECNLEFKNPHGVVLRMSFKKFDDVDLAALSKAFWRNGE